MPLDPTTNTTTQQTEDESKTVPYTGSDDRHQEMRATEEPPLSLDDVFEILSNERRRRALWYLAEQEGPVPVRELSEHVAAVENDKPVAQLTSQERKRVYVGLYQSHLPKMDDLGFVEYDKPEGIIELGPHAVHVAPYLQQTDEAASRWPGYYLGVVGAGWLLLVGSFVVGPLSPVVAVGVFVVLTTTLALVHMYSLRRATAGPSFAAAR